MGLKEQHFSVFASGNDSHVYLHIEQGRELQSQAATRDACGDTL